MRAVSRMPCSPLLLIAPAVLLSVVVHAEGRTKGSPPHSSMADPIGANITLFGDADRVQPTGDWAAELTAGFEGASISGYFFADWYKQTQSIARAQLVNSSMQIKLQQYSSMLHATTLHVLSVTQSS